MNINKGEFIMIKLEKDTLLKFTEIKNGRATGNDFINIAEGYIMAIYNDAVHERLNIGIEAIKDEAGDIVEYTENKFFGLPLEEQLDRCIEVNGERYASSTHYMVL